MKKTIFTIVCVVFSIAMLVATIMNTISITKLTSNKELTREYTYAMDCVREAELEYHRWYAEYVFEVQRYISTVAPTSNLRGYALVELCEKYNVDIKFALAQGEIESHFATTGLGAKICNVFNVGCGDGKSINEIDSQYKKQYPNESIEPYLKLITTRYLVGKLEGDLMENYVDVNGRRYASNPLYEEMMRTKYDYITKNTKIDEYRDKAKSYAVKCGRYGSMGIY